MSLMTGYTVVDLSHVSINAKAGASTPVEVGSAVVEKLRQWDKPVLISHTKLTFDGANVEIGGFTFHTVTAGIHTHRCGMYAIAVSSDTKITITQL